MRLKTPEEQIGVGYSRFRAAAITDRARIGPGRWLVGSQSPLAVYVIDLACGKIVAEYPFDALEEECVYAVCSLPDEFAEPPRFAPGVDPYAFWTRASPPPGVTPIPV